MDARTFVDRHVTQVRRFNRFYTGQIGLLDEGYLASPFSLAEVRVLYELAHAGPDELTARDLAGRLRLDEGYLSRILRRFADRGWLARTPSPSDRRQSLLRLTAPGRDAFAPLEARSRDAIAALLDSVTETEQHRLLDAMATIHTLLGGRDPDRPAPASWLMRDPRPGDMGWVIARHGALYAEEYDWDASFEALVAGIVAAFMTKHDPQRERCWIAERDGEPVGSIFLVRESDEVAKLRLLLVEPSARGLGIGGRLIEECVRFARGAGYRRITLWTNDCLHAARRLYERAGFRLAHREGHRSFGYDLIAETWTLHL